MNRRDFIKNSLLVGGCTCLAGGLKVFYDINLKEPTFNGIKLKKEYLIEEYKDKSKLSRKIRIDACTLCQLNCVCCPLRLYPEKVQNGCGLGYLKFKDFKNFVDVNDFEEIELSNNGEMFLNPELGDIIKYAYEKNIKLTAYSGVNLNYLTDEIAEALVKYKYKGVTVSIDGASPETYAIYRRGGDFNTVIKNVKKINYYKKKYNSEYPYLCYKFIVFGHNEHEIDKAKALAKKLNMKIMFATNFEPKYSPLKDPELVIKKTGLTSLKPPDKSIATEYKKDTNQWIFCRALWEAPQINWDGKVLGCCCVYYSDFGGNAFKEGLLKALNNPKMIYAKNMLAHNAEPIEGIPCTNCFMLQNLKKMNFSINQS